MLLARAQLRGTTTRNVPINTTIDPSDIIDFSAYRPLSLIKGAMTYFTEADDITVQSIGSRLFGIRINAAGDAFENGIASLYGESDAGVNPMLPDFSVAGGALTLSFVLPNPSLLVAQTAVLDWSFRIDPPIS